MMSHRILIFCLVVSPILLQGCFTGGSTATGPAEVTTPAPATGEKANPTVADAADAPPHPGGVAAPGAEPDEPMTTGLRAEGIVERVCREPGSGLVRLALTGKLTSRSAEEAPWAPCESCEGVFLRFVDDHSSWEKHLDQYADAIIDPQRVFSALFATTGGNLPGLYYLGVKILPDYTVFSDKKIGEQYPCNGSCLPPIEGVKTVKLAFSVTNPEEPLSDCLPGAPDLVIKKKTINKFIDVDP